MSAIKLKLSDFFASLSKYKFNSASILWASSKIPAGYIPSLGLIFSNESQIVAVFNHLAVAERWSTEANSATIDDVFETVAIVSDDAQREIFLGQNSSFSATWPGGHATITPVVAQDFALPGDDYFDISSPIEAYTARHDGNDFEFLVSARIKSSKERWNISYVPEYPTMFRLDRETN